MKKVLSAIVLLCLFSFHASAQLAQKFRVYFDFNIFSPGNYEKGHLDSIVAFAKMPGRVVERIEIAGHCDSIGSNADNDVLSQQRADAVRNYLVIKGVTNSLIGSCKGYGKHFPVISKEGLVLRSLNRRVEVDIYYSEPARAVPVPNEVKPRESTVIPDTAPQTMDLSKVAVNGTVVLNNIIFYPNSHEPEERSYPFLKILLNTLKQNKNLRIEIQGHVCCSSPLGEDQMDQDTYTPDLSVQRAKAIYHYLIDNGIEAERLSYHGFAGKHHLVKEVTEADKEKNRRVEIKILSK